MQSTPSRPSKGSKKEKAVNVRVIVRCRPPSEQENTINDRQVVHCKHSSNEVHVLGHKASDRVYTFDGAYGPNSTQVQIYDDVVSPIVDEVLAGFSCTVFAYGQTGTGKTFTMEGGDIDGDTAGIIPRCVNAVFQSLESVREWSVKVSFMECYNEQLRDLNSDDAEKSLKLFADNSKGSDNTGTLVQNLDETHVETPEEVFTIVRRCVERRQTAATDMNKNSSRSHSIFTLTVYSKDSNDIGEDVIKTGRLHLVDLAGSENIGRSGARNNRAKEAGNINKSLLTLGRVINALVENTGHVPYRESKLTRLLKESLGGRSKTCIIATVSPCVSSIEETLSTLDYAHRAKSIKNKPTVNQKMTHKAYMNELLAQIAVLKRETEVLRTKNGIILPPEQFEQMTADLKANSIELEELKAALDLRVAEYNTMKELYETTKTELDEIIEIKNRLEADIAALRVELAETRAELERTAQELAETRFLMEQHAHTEERIYGQSQELKGTLESVIVKKDALHDKVQRKAEVENVNDSNVSAFKTEMEARLSGLQQHIRAFAHKESSGFAALDGAVKSFSSDKAQQLVDLESQITYFATQVKESHTSLSMLRDEFVEATDVSVQHVADEINAAYGKVRQTMVDTQQQVAAHVATLTAQIQQQQEQLAAWTARQQQQLHDNVAAISKFVAEQQAEIASMRKGMHTNAEMQCAHLHSVAQSTEAFSKANQQESKAEAEQLMVGIQQLVFNFVAQRQKALDAHVSETRSAADSGAEEVRTQTSALDARQEKVSQAMDVHTDSIRQLCTFVPLVQEPSDAEVMNTVRKTQAAVDEGTAEDDSWKLAIQASVDVVKEEVTQFAEQHESVAFPTEEATPLVRKLDTDIRQQCSSWSADFAAKQEAAVQFDQTQPTPAAFELVQQFQLAQDMPTGTTPVRQQFQYPTNIERTRPHDDLLEEFRQQQQDVAQSIEDIEIELEVDDSTESTESPVDVDGANEGNAEAEIEVEEDDETSSVEEEEETIAKTVEDNNDDDSASVASESDENNDTLSVASSDAASDVMEEDAGEFEVENAPRQANLPSIPAGPKQELSSVSEVLKPEKTRKSGSAGARKTKAKGSDGGKIPTRRSTRSRGKSRLLAPGFSES